jgi:hypothetical protein
LLLAILEKEVAHLDLVNIRMHIESLKLLFLPFPLPFFILLSAFLFPKSAGLFTLLCFFNSLLSLLLALELLFFPLLLLFFPL